MGYVGITAYYRSRGNLGFLTLIDDGEIDQEGKVKNCLQVQGGQ